MRSRFTLLIGALMLIVSLLGSAQTAAAKAQHFAVSTCVDSDNGYTLCYDERSVVVARQTPSGREIGVDVTSFTYTLSLNGEKISSDMTKSHYVYNSEGGLSQLDRFNVRRTLSYIDPATGETLTCANRFVFVYAQGDIRHEHETLECPVDI
jgi:hypothetical protein